MSIVAEETNKRTKRPDRNRLANSIAWTALKRPSGNWQSNWVSMNANQFSIGKAIDIGETCTLFPSPCSFFLSFFFSFLFIYLLFIYFLFFKQHIEIQKFTRIFIYTVLRWRIIIGFKKCGFFDKEFQTI